MLHHQYGENMIVAADRFLQGLQRWTQCAAEPAYVAITNAHTAEY